MNHKFVNLIEEIKKMISDPEKIYYITFSDRRDQCGPKIIGEDIRGKVRISEDKSRVICPVFTDDTLDIVAEKLIKAQSLFDECLEYRRHKKESPVLSEALYYNIPEFQSTSTY